MKCLKQQSRVSTSSFAQRSLRPRSRQQSSTVSAYQNGNNNKFNPNITKLFENNMLWSQSVKMADPMYFAKQAGGQSPEFLWIGCADSRVPAEQLTGLAPGELFVQRNVGNQACHTDLNVMSCMEFSILSLKVKNVILCGHYNCGAVNGALVLPSKTPGIVNCWIRDIREAKNQHWEELKDMQPAEQLDQLCELNVVRQTWNVCNNPVVQRAWAEGQELAVHGCIYSIKDGQLKRLVGPITQPDEVPSTEPEFEAKFFSKATRTSVRA